MALPGKKRFRVAFSFAGEKRAYVAEVVNILVQSFSESAILYDKYHEPEFARADLGLYLPGLYHDESDLVVVVVCRDYEQKEWCGLEWKAIFDLLKKRKDSEVMLCRFDHATVKGLYEIAGFMELDDKTPRQTATGILYRLALVDGVQVQVTDRLKPKPGAGQKQRNLFALFQAARVLETRFVDLSRVYSGDWIAPFTPQSLSGDFCELYMLSRDPIGNFQECDPNEPRKHDHAVQKIRMRMAQELTYAVSSLYRTAKFLGLGKNVERDLNEYQLDLPDETRARMLRLLSNVTLSLQGNAGILEEQQEAIAEIVCDPAGGVINNLTFRERLLELPGWERFTNLFRFFVDFQHKLKYEVAATILALRELQDELRAMDESRVI
jgi:TIR domain